MAPDPSTVVVTGEIITMDPRRPRVDAVGIVDGRVVATGSRDEAIAACPSATPVLELPGTIAPGFIDSHVHMLWGGRGTEEIDVSDAASVAELLLRVREFAATHPAGAWVRGFAGIDAESLAEGRFPTATELDEAAAGRPVFLDRRAHDGFAGTTALAADPTLRTRPAGGSTAAPTVRRPGCWSSAPRR